MLCKRGVEIYRANKEEIDIKKELKEREREEGVRSVFCPRVALLSRSFVPLHCRIEIVRGVVDSLHAY